MDFKICGNSLEVNEDYYGGSVAVRPVTLDITSLSPF
jgi:hypothetical protein